MGDQKLIEDKRPKVKQPKDYDVQAGNLNRWLGTVMQRFLTYAFVALLALYALEMAMVQIDGMMGRIAQVYLERPNFLAETVGPISDKGLQNDVMNLPLFEPTSYSGADRYKMNRLVERWH